MRKVGIDITKNSRFNDYINNTSKLNKILSQEEIKYLINVTSEKRKIEFIASRFASKEALYKASNVNFSFSNVSVLNKENGAPYIVCDFLDNYIIEISISHETEYSIAIVILEEK